MADYNALTDEQARNVRRNLKRFREERGLSQEQAAEHSGIKIDTLRSYEIGKRKPKLGPLIALARIYGRPVEHFMAASPPDAGTLPPMPALVRFSAVGLDQDLYRKVADIIAATEKEQLLRREKERGRRGKKL